MHSPSTCNSENSRERRTERGSRRRALRSTCPRDALPTKLHQPANNSLYKGLMGSDDRRKAGGQLELPVERCVVAPLDGLISPNIVQPAEQVDDVEIADLSMAQ